MIAVVKDTRPARIPETCATSRTPKKGVISSLTSFCCTSGGTTISPDLLQPRRDNVGEGFNGRLAPPPLKLSEIELRQLQQLVNYYSTPPANCFESQDHFVGRQGTPLRGSRNECARILQNRCASVANFR